MFENKFYLNCSPTAHINSHLTSLSVYLSRFLLHSISPHTRASKCQLRARVVYPLENIEYGSNRSKMKTFNTYARYGKKTLNYRKKIIITWSLSASDHCEQFIRIRWIGLKVNKHMNLSLNIIS